MATSSALPQDILPLGKPTLSGRMAVRLFTLTITPALLISPPSRGATVQRPVTAPKPSLRSYEPTAHYAVRTIRGWTVLISGRFLKNAPQLAAATLQELESQLYQVQRVVPPPALAKIRRIRIWVEKNEPNTRCMAYHPGEGWLRQRNVNPEKARCVELANARNFLRWTKAQPWMVLHELAHGYHHQFLRHGFRNPEVRAAYEAAMKNKRYVRVLHIHGRMVRAYATTNPMEYFAELSEAFFGTNDFYPFVRAELKQHDPAAYTLLQRLWNEASASSEKKGRLQKDEEKLSRKKLKTRKQTLQ